MVRAEGERGVSEMVDRVARAIADVFRSENKDRNPETLRQAAILFHPAARAAIEAMREPTEAMCNAGNAYPECVASWIWPAMITEALK